MAVNIGELFGSLSWRHDKAGADEFDHRYDEAAAKAKKKIEAQLGAAVDDRAFAKYHEQLSRAERRAKERDAFKAALGADFDPKGFTAFSRAANQAERDAHKARAATKSFSDEIDGLNVKLPNLGRTMGLLKWPALIAGAGMAAQAVSAATAGVTALGSALAPLSGALAAYPALGSAAAQGIGVWKLATTDVLKVVGGLNEQMDTQSKAFKKLSPEAQNFARTLNDLKKPLTDLPAVAQKGMLPGLETGIKSASRNLDVVRPLIRDTAKAIGELAAEAGKLVGTRAFGRDLQTQGERNVKWIREGGTAGIHLFNALRNVTLAAGPLVDWMVRGAAQGAKVVDTFTAQSRESGKLAHFFDETRIAISRLSRIGADLAVAFFNIGKAGKPLGDDILVNLVKVADHFRRWTDSARGQNAIARYFREAHDPLFELGKLVHDIGVDFFNLGKGNQLAPMIRTIRVDLLPKFVELVDSTTKSFGPPMLEAIKQVAILFTTLGGTNGPLTMLVTLVGKIAGGINKATDAIPGLGSAISSLATAGSLYAALRIGASLSGLTHVIRLIKDARKATAVTGAVEVAGGAAAGRATAGGAAAGGATTAAARGGIAGAIVSKLPIAAVGAAIAVAIGAAIPKTKIHRKFTDFFNFDSVKLDDQLSAVDRFNKAVGRLQATGDQRGVDKLTDQFVKLKNAGHGLGSVKDIDRLTGAALDLAKAGGTLNRDIGKALEQAGKHFADFRRTGSNDLGGIKLATAQNMHFIKRTLGEDSAAGKEAIARNFRLARSAIRQAMDDGKISVHDGLALIKSDMSRELAAYGITGKVAKSIIAHGDIKGSGVTRSGDRRGGAQGGFGWQIKTGERSGEAKKAAGGWFGERGRRGQDTIHAIVGEGEAILNHHQQAVIESLLGDGFLDHLFATVRRPHYAALGGKIKRFAGGGIAGAMAAANQFEAAHFPYRWGGGHQATPAPFGPVDCSGAVSYVLQHAGINIPTMTSGQLAGAGKPGQGAITVFANPVHTFMRIGNRYFGTSGTNPGGGAGWMPDPGAGYRARFAQRGFAGGAGGIGGLGGFSSITAPRTGVPGALGAVVQASLGAAARGANYRVDQLVGSMGLGTGDAGDPGPTGSGDVVSAFRRAAASVRASPIERLALFEAGIVESGLRNLSGGDRDSVGALQQRASQGWTGLMNPYKAAIEFLSRAAGHRPWHGTAGQLAQAVQRSAFPARYDAVAAQARQYLGRGGRVQRFQGGGRAGFGFHRPTANASAPSRGPLSLQGGRNLGAGMSRILKSIPRIARLQTTRIAEYDRLQQNADDLDTSYGQQERVYNFTDEVLVDPDTGALNVEAINQRAAEIQGLIDIRVKIEKTYERMRVIAERVVNTYRTLIPRLRTALMWSRGKKREGLVSDLNDAETDLPAWEEKLHDLGVTFIPNSQLDIQELANEKASVLGTQAQPPDTSGADTSGDTTGTEAAPAPPSQLDIAAGVQAALTEFKSQQFDLVRNFGSNAVGARAAVAPGGVLSGTPDLEGAALGALRGFGGGTNLAGSLGPGASGPSVGQIVVNFASPPADAPTLMQQLRFQVENGGVA